MLYFVGAQLPQICVFVTAPHAHDPDLRHLAVYQIRHIVFMVLKLFDSDTDLAVALKQLCADAIEKIIARAGNRE